MLITKPMLAAKFKDIEELNLIKYPVLVTPKYDGIRALTIKDRVVSRTFKNIANKFVFNVCKILPNNLDGELITGNFNKTSSDIMSFDGEPEFQYHVFDYVKDDLGKPYIERMNDLEKLKLPSWCIKIFPVQVNSLQELEKMEKEYLKMGFEGLMFRDPNSAYKCGRGTISKMDLVKLKRFHDAEAKIVGFEEEMHNKNEAEKDNFGRTKRSSSEKNKFGKDTLGALLVIGINGDFKNIEFKLGTGFDQELRSNIWNNKKNLIGKIVKYKYQLEGGEDKPRFPVFLGFRDKKDL